MYKNILLCLDGGPADSQALDMGIYLAKQLGAKLHGLTVQDLLTLEGPLMYDISGALAFIPQMNFIEETRKAMEERSKNILSGFQKRAEEEGIPFETIIAQGIVYKVICEKAELNDLTILGRRGLNYQFDKDFLGSTTDRVMRHTQAPLLVVTHAFEPLKNPLLAYDGSHTSKKALTTATKLCSDLHLPLTVLHVGPRSEESTAILSDAKDYLDSYKIITKYELVEGKPHDEVSQYAKKHKHDLVIMGARGHRSILEFILGSTTQYTLWSGAFHVLVDR
jgi:nucleotide-binding universal stress UspA family protein